MQMSGAIATAAEALGEAGAGLRHVVKALFSIWQTPTTLPPRIARHSGRRVRQALSFR